MSASQKGHLDVVKYLVGNGASLDFLSETSWSSLRTAAQNGQLEVVKYLITFLHLDGEWEKLGEEEQKEHGQWLQEFMASLEKEKKTKLCFFKPGATKTVRLDAERRYEVTDGPVLAGADSPGGYYIIDAESLDEAVEWAKKGRWMVGANEVREVVEL